MNGFLAQFELIITVATLLLYAGAAALYLWVLMGDRGSVQRIAYYLAVTGLIIQSIGMTIHGIESHRMPFTNLFDSLGFVAWTLMLTHILIQRRYNNVTVGIVASLMALIAMAGAWTLPHHIMSSMPASLQSRWSSIHIVSCLIAYSSFVLAFGSALGYILQERLLRTKRIGGLQRRLPSLDLSDRLSYRMVAVGFPMLTLGVVTGALWAQSVWGSYWNWDLKETWALVTWLVYAAYLHVRLISGCRGKWPNRLLVTGFCCILITFIGANFLPGGWHKY